MNREQQLTGDITSLEIEKIEESALHFNVELKFFFVLSGYLELIKNDRCIVLRAGDVYLLNKGELVSILGSEDNLTLTLTMTLDYTYEDLFFRLDRPLSMVYKREAYEEFTSCLAALFTESNYQRAGYRQLIDGYSHYLLGLLIRYITISTNQMTNVDAQTSNKNEEVLQYLTSHYTEKLNLDQIADHFFLNKYYLAHIFKEKLGISIGSYLKELRLFHSVRMLEQTNEKIVDIALNNGFSSLRSFNKAFKEKFDTSPAAFRKKRDSVSLGTDKTEPKQDVLRLLAPYLQGKIFSERENVIQKVEVDTKQTSMTYRDIKYILKAQVQNMNQHLTAVRRDLGIKYFAVTNILDKITWSFDQKELVLSFSKLDYLLQQILGQHMIPYIQIQITDYDHWIEKKGQTEELLEMILTRLKYHLVNRYSNFKEWFIEFRCFYELGDHSKLCVPLAELIHVFDEYENIIVHFPVTPNKAVEFDLKHPDLVYCIDDSMIVKKLPRQLLQQSLHDDHFIELIRGSRNMQVQMQLLQKALMLEKDDYLWPYFDLALANLTIWQFINQRLSEEQYFTPISLDAEKVFEYFPAELADKVSLCTETGLIKESWYAYKFLNRLYETVIFKNDFCVVTKSRENYRILGAYPEEELSSFFYQKEISDVDESLKNAKSPLITLLVNLVQLKGHYKITKQELTPAIIDRRNELSNIRNSQNLSSEDVAFQNAYSKPSRILSEADIDGSYEVKIDLPIFGIVMFDLEKIQ
ncbi:hypothetical protein A5881_000735 [Enterococcus termitis]|nr:hypothetical protein A5881_000941 [Enterococcus termitis]